ncbi:MAG: ATP-dependent Clp protease ATP-binding subunit [Bifidobacteriaceae bacterium]|jgi:ATP-dependent Clp protease ATP-binding subunit ClpC|nr:ATP-dependent Clp protease ATP-binding subunit [Bifidobacteriaceae bacterium]
MFEKFTDQARSVVIHAQEEAKNFNHTFIGTEHLLLGLLYDENSNAYVALKNQHVELSKLREVIITIVGKGTSNGSDYKPFSPRAKQALDLALSEANKTGAANIGIDHIMLGIITEGEGTGIQALNQMDIDIDQIRQDILTANPALQEGELVTTVEKQKLPKGSILGLIGTDLTQMAKKGDLDPVVDRQNEIERVIQVLTRRTKNNPVLLGDPGVGKTAVVEGLAIAIAQGDVPQNLKDKKLYNIDLGQLVAGTRFRGDFEERIKKLTNELKERKDIIIFIDEIHTLVGAGGAEGSLDASNILKPMMARGQIQLIGATTIDEYRKYVERDAALERRLQPIDVDEPNVEQTVKILQGLKHNYEAYHNVTITEEAIQAAAVLSDRYISDRFMPDKAIDLMDEAAARLRIKQNVLPPELKKAYQELEKLELEKTKTIQSQQYEETARIRDQIEILQKTIQKLNQKFDTDKDKSHLIVDQDMIAEVLSMATGIPTPKISETEGQRLLEMEKVLHNRVIGQDEAIDALARSIRRTRAGLKDPKRPNGSFIFAGPTGVGKTELAKALAEFMFGSEDSLIRIDMSEFKDQYTVSRLIGTTPGFVGYGEGGQLTNQVRRKPYSVVLLDEIEKAHPDIFNILLQVLDDGRLTDGQGRVVDFKNTIIIMTTNLGSRRITQSHSTGFALDDDAELSYERMKGTVNNELKTHFRPEFINRLDDVIIFRQLEKEQVQEIADLLIRDLEKRLDEKHIKISVTPRARHLVAEKGFDRSMGARPLKRVVQHEIEDVIAEKILFKDLLPGQTITIDTDKPEKELELEVSS